MSRETTDALSETDEVIRELEALIARLKDRQRKQHKKKERNVGD